MGFKDKLMDLFVANDFDEEEVYEEQDSYEEKYEEPSYQSNENNNINNNRNNYSSFNQNKDRFQSQQTSRTSTQTSSNSLNFQNSGQLRVRVAKPERFEEVKEIANYLNDKYTVILNLESVGKDLSRRLIDFLSGVAYANNGRIKPVANSTFVITPNNVDVTGDDLWQSYETDSSYM